ncbi:receptor-like protein 7 [Abrus precatorius]|uniref:Receptor-like protein 7 n=1 Tax=Abrus precatorius TaxID=3816 RepID=A0A8B8K2E5_ABRPR|nr:receptor-like protein 7 [Abrus precatorius]
MRGPVSFWLFLIPFCLTNFSTDILAANGYCLGHEHFMLIHLKNSLIFNPVKSEKLVRWNQSRDCCEWHGITCNKGRVVVLDLSEESISGGFVNSSTLFSLQYLQNLNLAFNNFQSVIPPELHKLKNLRYLNLSMAGFEGQIPHEISHLERLVTLDLSSSVTSPHKLKLEQPNIAKLVQNLANIEELYLDGVAISAKGQEWCHALSSLHKLRVLSMSSCNLSGPIDSTLAELRSLSILKLSNNSMSSVLPESFLNFSNLATLQLSSCGLSGSFPKGIFQIPTLKVLDISDNEDLGGSLPNFPLHSSIQSLDLSHTNFSGKLPESISNLKQLSMIDISYCQFNGTLPSSLSELSQLVHLDLSSNNFVGPLPSFNMSKKLTYLSLFHNNLSGVLPPNHFEGLKNLVSIDLGFNLFSGSLPSSLLKLPYLRELKLPYNQLSGVLDDFLIPSSPLEMLDLGRNNFQGPIPMSIFSHRTLRVIQLNLNKFNGTIQLDKIRKLGNLTTLCLSHNNLTIDINYKDDLDLSPYPDIRNLMLGSCKLGGIPSFLRNQSTLLHLNLANNEIQGTIPNWIWQLQFLVQLNLSNNNLTSLEGNFWNVSSNILVLDLSSNQLQGAFIPFPRYANYLDLSSNRFNSTIPSDIGNNLPYTIILSLSKNNFQGEIPESICNVSRLRLLDVSNNTFAGMIPKCFATLSSTLRVLNIGGNKLQGYIPDPMPTSCTLKLLDLSDNLLEGTIPKSLVNCQKLQVLNLRTNMLSDRFPCFLSNISTLRIMDLRSNKLHGPIECPRSIGDSEMLHIVDLAFNNFSGKIPGALLNSWKAMIGDKDEVGPEFGHLFLDLYDHYDPRNFQELLATLDKVIVAILAKLVTNVSRSILDQGSSDAYAVDISRYQNSITIINKGLQMQLVKIQRAFTYVDMSSNYFEGPIPNELIQFKALNALNLSNNAFLGHIPLSIGNLKNLESLDLSNNSFIGEIPMGLASLSFLEYLNLSFNHLVGKIPEGTQIQSFGADSFEGNEKLCGPPLNHDCSNGLPPAAYKTSHSHVESSIDWNFLSAELGFIFGLGIFILPLIFWRRWRLWYSKHVDEMLYNIIPQLDFVYKHREGKRYRTLSWSY